MDQVKRKQRIEEVCKCYGVDASAVEKAARELGKLRLMSQEEIDGQLTDLEDEVVRHMQVTQAIRFASPIYV